MKIKNNFFLVFLILLMFSLFFRVDFRFKNGVDCCSDDYDYFAHAETIALDGDFDYSNQITEDHPYHYKIDGKIAPVGFPGSGILASPFLFIGNLIDNHLASNQGGEILSYKLLLYSLSPIFYYFFSYILLAKTLILLNFEFNKYILLVIFSGSGLTYFAFERFSMTHVYEVFLISLLILKSASFYKFGDNGSAIMLPGLLLLSYLVRMSNVFIFLIPLLMKFLVLEKYKIKNNLFNNYYYLSSLVTSGVLYCFISIQIYGKIIVNPQSIYNSNISINELLFENTSFLEFILEIFTSMMLILFGNEFGLIWTAPIICFALLLVLSDLKNVKRLKNMLLLLSFAQAFAIVYIWQSTGASYGFRYLYGLIPISIVFFYYYKERYNNHKIFNVFIIFFIFSNLATLFFETTVQTQLSTSEITNSFGVMANYSEPLYVTGVLKSFFEINSYLIIITTSFVGVIFFKMLLLVIDVDFIFDSLSSLGLPTDNEDFITYMYTLNSLSGYKILLVFLAMLLFSWLVVYKLDNIIK